MRGGDVPCAFARCVLKDEARKPGAAARVFNVLPATYNILLKMYFAPLMSFFRSHFSFFECAIGIDMSSDEV